MFMTRLLNLHTHGFFRINENSRNPQLGWKSGGVTGIMKEGLEALEALEPDVTRPYCSTLVLWYSDTVLAKP